MNSLFWSLIGYLGIIVAGVTLSFTLRRSIPRLLIRIATTLLIFLLVAAGAFVVLVFRDLFPGSPPTLEELQRDFAARRTALETILRMAEEDSSFSRIAPDFVEYGMHSYSYGDLEIPMSRKRWEDYRALFARNDIKLGVQRWNDDIFIVLDSEGLLNRGHSAGYLHCATDQASGADGFEPCTGIDPNDRLRGSPREIKNRFRKLDGNWYAFDEDANE